jgi:ABC-type nitrate/sulfonate/bicarbonate transport system substrate-binding protein
MSGLYLAQELGYFRELGLTVEIEEILNGAHSLALLAGRNLDVRFAALSPGLIHSVNRGSDLRIIAGREFASTTCGTVGTIYGNSKAFPHGLRDLTQLDGKRVSIGFRASLTEFYLDTLLETVGMSSNDVELIVLRTAEAAAALVSGKIDALVSSHFEKSLETQSDRVIKGIGLPDILPDFQYSFVFYGPSISRSLRKDEGVRFLAGYLRGAKAFLEGQTPQYLYGLARASKMDPEKVINECRETLVADGNIDSKSVQIFVDWTVSKGYCEQPVPAQQLIDTRYLLEAKELI